MELTYADITLSNSVDDSMARRGAIANTDVRQISVSALVASGAYMLTVDESIKTQLGLDVFETLEVELADGTRQECEIAGPVILRFKNRRTSCDALVLPGATGSSARCHSARRSRRAARFQDATTDRSSIETVHCRNKS